MKRVTFGIPDMTSVIAITYIYNDEKTYDQMVGSTIVTIVDHPSVMKGEEMYIVRPADRETSNPSDDGRWQRPKQG